MATTNDWFIFKSKISRPDFYLPQYNLFVEYWGLVDSPDAGTRGNTGKLHQDNALENGRISQEHHQVRLDISVESIRPQLLLQKEIQRSNGIDRFREFHNYPSVFVGSPEYAIRHYPAKFIS